MDDGSVKILSASVYRWAAMALYCVAMLTFMALFLVLSNIRRYPWLLKSISQSSQARLGIDNREIVIVATLRSA